MSVNIGLGIDVGGTNTDAVLIDLGERKILSFAKAPTTKDDLAKGISDALKRLGRSDDYGHHVSTLIKGQSVPDNIPIAVPWDEVTVRVPASAKRIRGKLNVPRERFRTNDAGEYVWAGKR